MFVFEITQLCIQYQFILFSGTHGHMKCVFNSQLKSQDTVLLNLYKRVFPKWTYQPNAFFVPAKEVVDE